MTSERQLDHALVAGMAWTASLRWPAQAISWIATAYAARMLTPGDYGLVSMAMIAIGLVRMVEDFGLDVIFVQDRSIVGEQHARLAGFVILMGFALCGLFVVTAYPIAVFFDEAQVAPIVMLLSLLCVADAIQVVPRAELQREMKYGLLAIAQFFQIVVTQGVLVLGAWLAWGVWALVFNTLIGAFAVTALLLYWRPYRIRWPRQVTALAKPLLSGWRVLASRAAYYAYSNADQVVVGRLLGKDALGAYSFATTLSTTLSQEVASVVSKVVPGIFSTVQNRPDQLRRYFLILTELLSYIALPISVGIGLTADYVVRIVLGPQWQSVVMPLQILCAYAAFYTSQMLVGQVLMWTGQFRANMWCSVFAGVVLPLSFLAGTRWGLEGVALAWSIAFPLANLPGMIICFRTIKAGFGDWLGALWPAVLSCAALAAALLATRAMLPPDMPVGLAAALAVGAGTLGYLATLGLVFRRRAMSMLDFLRALRRQPPEAPKQLAPDPIA